MKQKRIYIILLIIVFLVRISMPGHSQTVSGESKTYSFKILNPSRADKTGPAIILTSPQIDPGATLLTDQLNLFIEGKAEDPSGIYEIKVNNKPVTVAPNGSFRAMVSLQAGTNTILLTATDASFNTSEAEYSIRRTESVSPSSRLMPGRYSSTTGVGDFYALIIGINNYKDEAIMNLDQPISDATSLYNILTNKYTFDSERIFFLKDPGRAAIIDHLDKLVEMVSGNDNLLIFFAGHGWWDENRETGYWFPSDSRKSSTANWLRNSTLQEYIDDIGSRHTLLIADACFSGGIFKTRSAFGDAPGSIEKLYELPSRKAMTSGTLKEVPDKSVFLQQLISSLERNNSKYISALQLFSDFRENVLNNSPNAPQYGVIQDTGDEGGEFIFILK